MIEFIKVGALTVRIPTLILPIFADEEQPELKATDYSEFQYLTELLVRKPTETVKLPPRLPIENELNYYLTSAVAASFPVRGEPSKFWVNNATVYPELSVFALDVLVIQCSSAPSERLVSTAGEATVGKKNRLSGENLEQKVFVGRNAKYLDFKSSAAVKTK